MSNYINERVLDEAKYMIKSKNTIREVAKKFNTSKSTVHKDFKDRLKRINSELYKEVKVILDDHLSIRHIKGGESTRKKFLLLKESD